MNFGAKAKDTPGLPPENDGDAEEEELNIMSFGRGRGRGKAKGWAGAGDYEMVGMKEPIEEDV